jgi:hypothetical protein
MPRVQVELLNTESSAVEAVRATMAQAPILATLTQEGEKFFAKGSSFALWAIEKQGYVKRVLHDTQTPD